MLLAIAAVGLVGGNEAVGLAALLALGVRGFGSQSMLQATSRITLDLGIVLLVLSLLLTALSTGTRAGELFGRVVLTRTGLVSVLIGFFSSRLASDGVDLMQRSPETLVGLVLGSLAGVWALGGIPVGPLVAAGLVSLLLRLVGR